MNATETINDPNGQFQTFGFTGFTGFTGLQSLTFGGNYSYATQSGSYPLFDNLVLTPAAVPEASTTISLGLLLALGLGGMAISARRHKTAVG